MNIAGGTECEELHKHRGQEFSQAEIRFFCWPLISSQCLPLGFVAGAGAILPKKPSGPDLGIPRRGDRTPHHRLVREIPNAAHSPCTSVWVDERDAPSASQYGKPTGTAVNLFVTVTRTVAMPTGCVVAQRGGRKSQRRPIAIANRKADAEQIRRPRVHVGVR